MRLATITAFLLALAVVCVPACKKKDSSSSTENQNTPAPGPTPPAPTPAGNAGLADPNAPTTPVFGPSSPRVAAARQSSNGNLRQIGVAMHNVHDTYNSFPAGIYDKTGKVGLSWRVAILPFIEQENLYRQFHLDEPWDSDHNKTLIPMMPKTFDAGSGSKSYTFYRSFTMPPPGKSGQAKQLVPGLRLTGISDGSSNTFMVAEAGEAVIWTKPDELVYSPNGPAPKLGGVFADGFNVTMCDGSVKWFTKSALTDAELKALITANGGEIVNIP
jgi:hypothetical protein